MTYSLRPAVASSWTGAVAVPAQPIRVRNRSFIRRARTQVHPETPQLKPSSIHLQNHTTNQTHRFLYDQPKTSAIMPSYIVTCKENATPEQVEAAKKQAKDQGGKIGHEYNLIKGFQVTFPEGHVQTLDSNEHVKAVEADGEVRIQ